MGLTLRGSQDLATDISDIIPCANAKLVLIAGAAVDLLLGIYCWG